jgi:hypothetical protein
MTTIILAEKPSQARAYVQIFQNKKTGIFEKRPVFLWIKL